MKYAHILTFLMFSLGIQEVSAASIGIKQSPSVGSKVKTGKQTEAKKLVNDITETAKTKVFAAQNASQKTVAETAGGQPAEPSLAFKVINMGIGVGTTVLNGYLPGAGSALGSIAKTLLSRFSF